MPADAIYQPQHRKADGGHQSGLGQLVAAVGRLHQPADGKALPQPQHGKINIHHACQHVITGQLSP